MPRPVTITRRRGRKNIWQSRPGSARTQRILAEAWRRPSLRTGYIALQRKSRVGSRHDKHVKAWVAFTDC